MTAGAELNDSLKALKDDILRARQKHPQVHAPSRGLCQRPMVTVMTIGAHIWWTCRC
jgi:hypothetical protein